MTWPQVGTIHADDKRGTGFVAGVSVAITALHVVADAEQIELHLPDRTVLGLERVVHPVEQWMSSCDIAVLTISGGTPPTPLASCPMPADFPIAYLTWGYRSENQGVFSGAGTIKGPLSYPHHGRIQLETHHQLPGMSGAPLGVRSKDPMVVAIGTHGAKPEARDPTIALGTAIEQIPSRVRHHLHYRDNYPKLADERTALVGRITEVERTETEKKEAFHRRIHLAVFSFPVTTIAPILCAFLWSGTVSGKVMLLAMALAASGGIGLLYLFSLYNSAQNCSNDAKTLARIAASPGNDEAWAFTQGDRTKLLILQAAP